MKRPLCQVAITDLSLPLTFQGNSFILGNRRLNRRWEASKFRRVYGALVIFGYGLTRYFVKDKGKKLNMRGINREQMRSI
jgi:hypothetical protein